MIKVEVIENFTLQRFDELKNIERATQEVKGKLFAKDRFECSKELTDYLLGNNPLKKAVVKLIEVVPEEETIEEKPKKKKSKSKKVIE